MEFTHLWKCRTRIYNRTWKTARKSSSCRPPEPRAAPPCTIPPCRWLWTYLSAQYCKKKITNKIYLSLTSYALLNVSQTWRFSRETREWVWKMLLNHTVNVIFFFFLAGDNTRLTFPQGDVCTYWTTKERHTKLLKKKTFKTSITFR